MNDCHLNVSPVTILILILILTLVSDSNLSTDRFINSISVSLLNKSSHFHCDKTSSWLQEGKPGHGITSNEAVVQLT